MEVDQHKHCLICGRAVPLKQQYCSKRCKAQHMAARKKQKMWMNILWALMIFLVIVLIMGGG